MEPSGIVPRRSFTIQTETGVYRRMSQEEMQSLVRSKMQQAKELAAAARGNVITEASLSPTCGRNSGGHSIFPIDSSEDGTVSRPRTPESDTASICNLYSSSNLENLHVSLPPNEFTPVYDSSPFFLNRFDGSSSEDEAEREETNEQGLVLVLTETTEEFVSDGSVRESALTPRHENRPQPETPLCGNRFFVSHKKNLDVRSKYQPISPPSLSLQKIPLTLPKPTRMNAGTPTKVKSPRRQHRIQSQLLFDTDDIGQAAEDMEKVEDETGLRNDMSPTQGEQTKESPRLFVGEEVLKQQHGSVSQATGQEPGRKLMDVEGDKDMLDRTSAAKEPGVSGKTNYTPQADETQSYEQTPLLQAAGTEQQPLMISVSLEEALINNQATTQSLGAKRSQKNQLGFGFATTSSAAAVDKAQEVVHEEYRLSTVHAVDGKGIVDPLHRHAEYLSTQQRTSTGRSKEHPVISKENEYSENPSEVQLSPSAKFNLPMNSQPTAPEKGILNVGNFFGTTKPVSFEDHQEIPFTTDGTSGHMSSSLVVDPTTQRDLVESRGISTILSVESDAPFDEPALYIDPGVYELDGEELEQMNQDTIASSNLNNLVEERANADSIELCRQGLETTNSSEIDDGNTTKQSEAHLHHQFNAYVTKAIAASLEATQLRIQSLKQEQKLYMNEMENCSDFAPPTQQTDDKTNLTLLSDGTELEVQDQKSVISPLSTSSTIYNFEKRSGKMPTKILTSSFLESTTDGQESRIRHSSGRSIQKYQPVRSIFCTSLFDVINDESFDTQTVDTFRGHSVNTFDATDTEDEESFVAFPVETWMEAIAERIEGHHQPSTHSVQRSNFSKGIPQKSGSSNHSWMLPWVPSVVFSSSQNSDEVNSGNAPEIYDSESDIAAGPRMPRFGETRQSSFSFSDDCDHERSKVSQKMDSKSARSRRDKLKKRESLRFTSKKSPRPEGMNASRRKNVASHKSPSRYSPVAPMKSRGHARKA